MTNTNQRRPFFSYIIPYGDADARYDIKCDAYGFEMSVDSEWEIDMILLTDSQYVDIFSTETAVTSEGSVFVGSSQLRSSDDLKKLAKLGSHVLVEINDDDCLELLQSSYAANLTVILRFVTGGNMSKAILDEIKPDQTIMVLEGAKITPSNAQDLCSQIRTIAPEFESMRIGVIASANEKETLEYFAQPDVDGILNPDFSFDDAIEALEAVVESFES